MPRALAPEMAAAMAVRLMKAEGFTYVALDLEGYRQGSLNETLSPVGQRSAKAARRNIILYNCVAISGTAQSKSLHHYGG